MRYFVKVGADTVELEVERGANSGYQVRGRDGQVVSASLIAQSDASHTLLIDGQVLEVQASEGQVMLAQERFSARAESERDRAAARPAASDARGSTRILAPMPGRIVHVSCQVGDAVSKGASLVVIEAMKMQNELCAKADQVVRAVCVVSGETVDRGAVLLEFE